jgi:tetratricopeptide (TPR) repeat protein
MKKLLALFLFFIIHHSIAQQSGKQEFDSLKHVLLNSKEDTNKAKTLIRIAFLFQDNVGQTPEFDNNPDTGLYYAQEGLKLSQKLNFEKGKFYNNYYLARIYWRKGIFNLAVKLHLEALSYAEKMGDKNLIAVIHSYIGQDYADDGKYNEAIKYLDISKTVYADVNDIEGVANTNLLLAWVYSSSGNYPESSKWNLEAMRQFESIQNEYGIAVASSNTAENFSSLKNTMMRFII